MQSIVTNKTTLIVHMKFVLYLGKDTGDITILKDHSTYGENYKCVFKNIINKFPRRLRRLELVSILGDE